MEKLTMIKKQDTSNEQYADLQINEKRNKTRQ